ncbi:MAG: hypothetical protein LBF90_01900 [Prevotellaceae bacterium]|jgi:cell division protein FtsQ|nr:hypothetical protein [Prevotellaceae bacterium]
MRTKSAITTGVVAVLFVAYLTVVTGFVSRERQHIRCRAIRVTIGDSAVNRFVDAAAVRRLLDYENLTLLGTPVDRINTRQIEATLQAQPVVREAQACTSIDGVLHIRVGQRRPVLRVLAEQGSFYIDETGCIFPFSPDYTSYVPVVTGRITPSFKAGYTGDIPERDYFLKQLYAFGLFLERSDFWRAQVLQIHVKNPRDIEIIPRVGNQLIKLGSLEQYEYKLKKLYAFYREALPREGWERFSKFDLRYGNQVVATRRASRTTG